MSTRPIPDFKLQEVDSDGQATATFHYDAVTKAIQVQRPTLPSSTSASSSLLMRLMDPFLPAGYPSSVSPDYTRYQIYDSLQAFASTIAGLLASRAVFVGMGVGSEDASVVTTMLLYIAQETIGQVATILFAHRFSQRIEAEVKFYRFFADIVNDIAFILDCLSPGLPVLGRVCTLCVSNACRAVCGVSGSSSKAILSSHFARAGNIGELNAKDGSQETVVGLIGMWAGGLVVSKVQGTVETWCCLIPLLALHLWANWKAVRSVRLTSLNTERAAMLFAGILRGRVKGLDEIGHEESILGLTRTAPRQVTAFQVGVSVPEFLKSFTGHVSSDSQVSSALVRLLEIFQDEEYVLWFDSHTGQGRVLLKESATGETQAKAMCHFLRILEQENSAQKSRSHDKLEKNQHVLDRESSGTSGNGKVNVGRQGLKENSDKQNLRWISDTLRQNRQAWQNLRSQVEQAGWELRHTNLVRGYCHRIRTNDMAAEDKKDR